MRFVLSISIAALGDANDEHDEPAPVNFVEDAIVADTHTPHRVFAREFHAAGWPWIQRQRVNRSGNPLSYTKVPYCLDFGRANPPGEPRFGEDASPHPPNRQPIV